MVRPIARKKLRNPKLKTTRRTAGKARKIKYTGHPLLRDQWDRGLTVTENYKKMGLQSRLNGIKGGVVQDLYAKPTDTSGEDEGEEQKEMTEKEIRKAIPKGYGIIERDEEGNVTNVIVGEEEDPLDSDYEADKVEPKMDGARRLEDWATHGDEPKERWMSEGGRRALQDMIDAHGENYDAMFWDRKLNRQQLPKQQIKKKIQQYLVEKSKIQ
ncbi:Nucleolar protein 16 [Kickxella alabastrina]|nr:Nucleolar protein 16 [Kickxella alabastrina]